MFATNDYSLPTNAAWSTPVLHTAVKSGERFGAGMVGTTSLLGFDFPPKFPAPTTKVLLWLRISGSPLSVKVSVSVTTTAPDFLSMTSTTFPRVINFPSAGSGRKTSRYCSPCSTYENSIVDDKRLPQSYRDAVQECLWYLPEKDQSSSARSRRFQKSSRGSCRAARRRSGKPQSLGGFRTSSEGCLRRRWTRQCRVRTESSHGGCS